MTINTSIIDMSGTANPQTSAISFNPDLLPTDDEGIAFAERIYAMHEQYAALVERKRQSDIANYSSEHEALIMERRKLAEQEQELAEEQRQLKWNADEIEKQLSSARINLKRLREDDAPNPMWATQADLDKYNAKVATADRALALAQSDQATHNAQVQDWRDRTADVMKQIDGLGEKVKSVWLKLERTKGNRISSTDPARGLPE